MKLLIIGAGPGGYETAIRAAQLGHDVTLVEKGELGGTCLNIGCIPTKTLVKIASLYKDIKRSEEFGIEVEGYKLNEETIYERKKKVVKSLQDGIDFLFKGYPNLTYIQGFASFKDNKTVVVKKNDGGEEELTFDKCIVATGSKDMNPLPGKELPNVLSSTDLLNLKEIPKSMIVIGTGVIGLEFASIYSIFGTEVTVIGNNVFKVSDGEVQKRLKSVLKSDTLKFEVKQRAQKIEQDGDLLKVTTKMTGKDKEKEYTAEYVLVALGRSCNTDGLNTEAAGLETEKGGLVVDKNLMTNVENIYAIGDVIYGNTQLAHLASAQGIWLVEKFSDVKTKIRLDLVPSVLYTTPEVAMIGKTEEELTEEGVEFIKSKFLYQSNGKALSASETEGFVKIIATPDKKKILGCHILGAEADFMIHFANIAMTNDLSVEDLTDMIYAHPTVSEVFKDAVVMLENKSINTPNTNK